ncbi:MAG: L,D-transpeptidase family protein, partial [Salinisphaeraceae bacterium]|nr:L,D-transpeptidase family protein [Salinisphaeraceae bacterium]
MAKRVAEQALAEAGDKRFIQLLLKQPELKRKAWLAFYANGETYWLKPDAGWLGGAKPSDAAEALLKALAKANSHGLRPADYGLEQLKALADDVPEESGQLVEAELRFMRAYLDYYRHLAEGRYPELKEESRWYIEQNDYSEALALQRLRQHGPTEALELTLPALQDYALLRKARKKMQAVIKAGGWPKVPSGPLLKPGMKSERVPFLRQRLQAAGLLPRGYSAPKPNLYDEVTVAALKAFQSQYGLQEDGILGPAGLAMLNYPAERRLAQIDANLERLRWLPQKLADDRLVVNIAAFNLRGYRNNQELINMRVVVGEEEHETPTFDDRLEYIEINPYWSIPNSIVVNELAPKQVQNVNYLASRNMQVYEGWEDDDTIDADDIDWDDYNDPEAIFPHVIKQDPGPGNALGRIKFMFPNKYSIYLHDTPETNLFWAADRSYSHGCVRVHK